MPKSLKHGKSYLAWSCHNNHETNLCLSFDPNAVHIDRIIEMDMEQVKVYRTLPTL